MRISKKQKQKRTIVGLVIAIISLLMFTTAMTFAYFTASNRASSSSMQFGTLEIVFTGSGENRIGLSNETTSGTHALVPGCTISITGEVTLGTSTIDAFVRLKPEASITSTWGNDKSITKEVAEGQLNALVIGAFESTGAWLRPQEDSSPVGDYVYYAGKFLPSASTAVDGIKAYNFATNNVAFTIDATTFGNDWQDCEFEVTIVAEAIQAEHVDVTLTGTAQAKANAIAGAKATGETNTAWSGLENGEQSNSLSPEESLQYLDFDIVNYNSNYEAWVSEEGVSLASDNGAEMSTLNGGKATNSNLMVDGTKFAGVKSKVENYAKAATGNISIPAYVKFVNNIVQVATQAEWEANNAYKVVCIEGESFWNCDTLTGVVIPNSVTDIGHLAFCDCNNLESVTLPEGLAIIRESAFANCSSLTSIVIPSSITSMSGAFCGCTSLESVTLREGITTIEGFSGCSSLTSVVIPNSATSIGWGAFESTGLESITIPSGVTSIDNAAFADCDSLSVINFNATCCDNSLSDNTMPFENWIGGVPVTLNIGENVTIIGTSMFSGSNISEINFLGDNPSLTEIGGWAFCNCYNLMSVTIPVGLNTTEIDSYAFDGCAKLVNVRNLSGQTLDCFPDNEDLEILTTANTTFSNRLQEEGDYITFSVGSNKYLMGFKGAPKAILNDLPSGITGIYTYAFSSCGGVTNITIPNGVTSIGDYAFSECMDLESIIISSTITNIGTEAFWYCSNLTSVTFGITTDWSTFYYGNKAADLSSSDLSDEGIAATYLTETYHGYEWIRS